MTRTPSGPRPQGSVFPPRAAAPAPDPERPLAGTTLLFLSPDDSHLAAARALGGIALHVGSSRALLDWLAHHPHVHAAVLIDDPRLSPQDLATLAGTLRHRHADVALTLVTDPESPLPGRAPPGTVTRTRPLDPDSFTAAMLAARAAAAPADAPPPAGPWTPPPASGQILQDPPPGPLAGLWIVPLVGLGLGLWITLGASLLGLAEARPEPVSPLSVPRS